jgi:hypothetical protein
MKEEQPSGKLRRSIQRRLETPIPLFGTPKSSSEPLIFRLGKALWRCKSAALAWLVADFFLTLFGCWAIIGLLGWNASGAFQMTVKALICVAVGAVGMFMNAHPYLKAARPDETIGGKRPEDQPSK